MRIPRNPKQYELTNHLGNVLSTVLDRKTPITATGGSGSSTTITHYEGDVVFANDYYPFGSPRSWSTPDSSGGRMYSGAGYRYGFNGQEKDDEIKGESNSLNFNYRVYDPRLGRFLSVDPLAHDYPWNSPYSFAENDVIRAIDFVGLEKWINNQSQLVYGPYSLEYVDQSGIKHLQYVIQSDKLVEVIENAQTTHTPLKPIKYEKIK